MNRKTLENLEKKDFLYQRGAKITLSIANGRHEVTFDNTNQYSYHVWCGPLHLQPESIKIEYSDTHATFRFAVEGGYAEIGEMKLLYGDIDDKIIVEMPNGTWIIDFVEERSE